MQLPVQSSSVSKSATQSTQGAIPNVTNPILRGFNPDPSICRAGDDYFIVTSTFEFFPGVPVYHSKDLTNWKLIGHVLTRRSQLELRTGEPGAGIWATTIRYREQEKRWYVISGKWDRYRPQNNERVWPRGFYVYSDNIWDSNAWSDPIYFDQPGFDQDVFWDDDGKVYLSTCHRFLDRPADSKLKDFGVHICEIDIKTGDSTTPPVLIRKSTSGIAEGSHIIKKGKYYYLFTAEGGTEEGHCEWVFRSDKGPLGPWEMCENNPLWRNTIEDEVQNTGHADLLEDSQGNWYGVFLGVRPHRIVQNGKTSWEISQFGRETFIVSVKWENDWPVFNHGQKISLKTYIPGLKDYQPITEWQDNFDNGRDITSQGWFHKHTPLKKEYSLDAHPGYLRLNGGPYNLTYPENPTMLLQRQTEANVLWSTELLFFPNRKTYEAGTVLWWNYFCFTSIGIRTSNNKRYIFIKKAIDGKGVFEDNKYELPSIESDDNRGIELFIKSSALKYDFGYRVATVDGSEDDIQWLTSVTTQVMTQTPPIGLPFAGMAFGLYAFGELEKCLAPADFRYAKWKMYTDSSS